MNKEEAIQYLLRHNWPTDDELVEFAERGHGFGGDDGYYGITYPDDLDEYEIEVEKRKIPNGMIEIDYWDGQNDSLLVEEEFYLEKLKEYFANKGKLNDANKIDTLITKALSRRRE